MKAPGLVMTTVSDDGDTVVQWPGFIELTHGELLKIVGDTPVGRGFIAAAAWDAVAALRYHQYRDKDFLKDASVQFAKLREGISLVRSALQCLDGIESMQLLFLPGGSVPDSPPRWQVNERLAQLEVWSELWEPLVKRGRGRRPGTKSRNNQLALALRIHWNSFFQGSELGKDTRRCNDAIFVILKASGVSILRHEVADLGRDKGARTVAKSNLRK